MTIIILPPKLTDREWKVMEALREGTDRASGRQLSEATHLWSGELYPAISSLEAKGLVTSEWEEALAGREHRRRLYDLTDRGHEALLDRSVQTHSRSSWWLVLTAIIVLCVGTWMLSHAG